MQVMANIVSNNFCQRIGGYYLPNEPFLNLTAYFNAALQKTLIQQISQKDDIKLHWKDIGIVRSGAMCTLLFSESRL